MEIYGYCFNRESDIKHHGILGMKWGVRRWQNSDGTFNEAGKDRYFDKGTGENYRPVTKGAPAVSQQLADKVNKAKSDYKQAKKDYNKATLYGSIYDEKATKNLDLAARELKWAKDDIANSKIKDKLAKETKISTSRQKLIDKYKSKGMNDEEAAIAAYKKERAQKIFAAAAGVAVTAAVAYGVYKYREENVDKIINSGVKLQRISPTDSMGVHDAYYAVFSKNKMDANKYAGIYANQLKTQGAKDVFKKTLEATTKLKMASPKSATGTLQELAKDPSYKKELEKALKKWSVQAQGDQYNALYKAYTAVEKGQINKDVYKGFNIILADQNSDLTKKFYSSLRQKGYDAIMDYNDKKYSGYKTNMPVIVLNSANTAVKSVTKLGQDSINSANSKAYADIYLKTFMPTIAKGAAFGTGVALVSKAKDKANNDAIVQKYKKEHPNTEMPYNEIIRNYYRNK